MSSHVHLSVQLACATQLNTACEPAILDLVWIPSSPAPTLSNRASQPFPALLTPLNQWFDHQLCLHTPCAVFGWSPCH